MTTEIGRLVAVSVGRRRQFEYHGRPAESAIWKSPVAGRVAVRGVNLEGDEQADRAAHGGSDKAVYSYALEDKRWWESEIGRTLEHGEFGENLTTEGINVTGALVGEHWQVGSTLLEVSEPRIPCWRFAVRMNDNAFIRHFTQAGRPGAYLRIIEEGEVGAGDEIRVLERPEHGVSISDVFRIYTKDRHELEALLAVPQLSEGWRRWAENGVGNRREKE